MASIKLSRLRRTEGQASSDISIIGPTTVVAGTSNTYTITDYDDFSVYEVQVSDGSVSRSDEVITLDVPSSGDSIIAMTVSRNNSFRDFEIAVGASGVATPTITYPSSGSTNIPNSFTIQASAFSTVPAGISTHKESRFQIARDVGFTDLVVNSLVTTGNLTQLPVSGLVAGQQYYARVKYFALNGSESAYSNYTTFTVSSQTIAKPIISSNSGTVNVPATPSFTGSAFIAIPAGSDSHVSSTWVLRDATTTNVVWQSVNDSVNKVNITIPAGVLSVSTSYTMEVQYNGGFGSSMFSDKLTFSTASSFVPDTPGAPFGGGYYAGKINVGGQIYALVIAPKSLGGDSPSTLQWKTDVFATTGTASVNNGWANTQAMVTAGIAAHPAANFCRNLNIGGYTDWYLPSRDELEILYRSFKPTTESNYTPSGVNSSSVPPTSNYTSGNPAQTSIALFKSGGAEAMTTDVYYWSSTGSSGGGVYFQSFQSGEQNIDSNISTKGARAVRRVPV